MQYCHGVYLIRGYAMSSIAESNVTRMLALHYHARRTLAPYLLDDKYKGIAKEGWVWVTDRLICTRVGWLLINLDIVQPIGVDSLGGKYVPG